MLYNGVFSVGSFFAELVNPSIRPIGLIHVRLYRDAGVNEGKRRKKMKYFCVTNFFRRLNLDLARDWSYSL